MNHYPHLFVRREHIMTVCPCSPSSAYRKMAEIRKQFGILRPKKITVDHFCEYEGITVLQYFRTLGLI